MRDRDLLDPIATATPATDATLEFASWDAQATSRPHSPESVRFPPATALHSASEPEPMLRNVITALRRRSTIVLLFAIAFPCAALAFSTSAEKQYTATAKLLFRDPGFDQKLFGSQLLTPSVDPNREAATNISLVGLDTVATRTANAIKSRTLTAADIRKKVLVSAAGQSNVVTVSATDADPAFSAKLANSIARQYIAFRRDADRAKINQGVRLVQQRLRNLSPSQQDSADGVALHQQVDQLKVLAALQTGNAELVQRAEIPDAPSSPKPARNTIIALFFGLALGGGLALVLNRFDSKLRDRDDAEAQLGRPVLGTIPESRSLRSEGGDALHLEGREAEAFRTLRANLRYYDIDRDIRSLLVTSSAPGDGKSTVARCLAATAAAASVRVVLVEADLRRPTLNGLYPSLNSIGLSEVLSDQAPLEAALQSLPVSLAGAPTGKSLDVIGAGTPPPNPTDLLESDRMRNVLDELHARYDLVIVDSSPITVVPDSIPVLNQVSGVLVVMRESKSTTVGVRRLRDQLAHLGILPLGLVMNGTAAPEEKSSYGYYSYAPAAPAAAPAKTARGWRRKSGERADAGR
jgi:succinoglycan biosynthesis transport protein ExoP